MTRNRHLGRLTVWGLGAWLGVACAATTVAAPLLPPVVQPATTEHHVGKVIWADLVTPDLERAKQFYGGLFGWTFKDTRIGDTSYAVAQLDGEPVGGLVQRSMGAGEHRQSAWLTFIAVRDVDAIERAARNQGAKVLSAPRAYAQRGRQAVFADPQGAVFAVLQSSSGDPEDYLVAPGAWIWSALLTRDAGAAAGFYQTVFGYEVFEQENDDGREHVVFSSDEYARASANELPADAAKARPHWLNFVRVTSASSAASRAKELGGRVLVAPHEDRQGAMAAVLADPLGAPFGVLEWSDKATQETAK